MAGYATLQEAYNIESFNPKKRKEGFKNRELNKPSPPQISQNKDNNEGFMNDYSLNDACYFSKEYQINKDVCDSEKNGGNSISKFGNYVPNEKFTGNNTDVKDYKSNTMNKQGESCSPLQTPNYNYPISEENKAQFKKVIDTYTNIDNTHISYNDFNKNKEDMDIMPYYDEDMDQYLDINTLKSSSVFTGTYGTEDKKENSLKYMPNYNEKSYTDDNTDKYLNINTKTEDILVAPEYNLSEEDRKNSLRALNILKKFDTSNKVNGNDNSNNIFSSNKSSENTDKQVDNYSIFLNIALFIFIGIVIILLCDQITELAINIGMKRATEILEPYLNKQNNIQSELSIIQPIKSLPIEIPAPLLPISEIKPVQMYQNSLI